MTPRDLERAIRDLLAGSHSDTALREALETLAAREISFDGFTWLFGPELYRRNRLLFHPFILSHFSSYMTLPKWRIQRIGWKGAKAGILDAWLAEVDQKEDNELFRRLYEWRLSEQFGWRRRDARARAITTELLTRFKAATSPAERQSVLRKFDLWFELDESAACELYEKDAIRSAGA